MIVLFLLGALAMSSMMMVVGWGIPAVQLARGGSLHWNKAWLIAASLTLHAMGMTVACIYRTYDAMVRGYSADGSDAGLFLAILISLAISKAGFVWAASIDSEERHVRWPWWAFVISLIPWLAMVILWGWDH